MDEATAASVMRAAGLVPLEPYVVAAAPWRCRCTKCGKVVAPSYANVRKGGGCVGCALRGIDPDEPAIVYLTLNEKLRVLKVGIGAASGRRLDAHSRRGWTSLGSWTVSTGRAAHFVEKEVIRWWRNDLGAPTAVPKEAMPQSGYTETAALVYVDENETLDRIRQLIRVFDSQVGP